MTDPVIIPSGFTALEVIQDMIVHGTTPTPVPGTNIFMGYHVSTVDDPALVYIVSEGPAGAPITTMGTAVATEVLRIDVLVYGGPGDYQTPKIEAMRLRYLIASKADYVAGGLRVMYCEPIGMVDPLGKDPLNREHFMIRFKVFSDPSYS